MSVDGELGAARRASRASAADPAAEVRLLLSLSRAGRIPEKRLLLAAGLGFEPARLVRCDAPAVDRTRLIQVDAALARTITPEERVSWAATVTGMLELRDRAPSWLAGLLLEGAQALLDPGRASPAREAVRLWRRSQNRDLWVSSRASPVEHLLCAVDQALDPYPELVPARIRSRDGERAATFAARSMARVPDLPWGWAWEVLARTILGDDELPAPPPAGSPEARARPRSRRGPLPRLARRARGRPGPPTARTPGERRGCLTCCPAPRRLGRYRGAEGKAHPPATEAIHGDQETRRGRGG